MQIGVISSTAFTPLIPLAQTRTQLVMIRLLAGLDIGFALSAPRGHVLAHGVKNTLLADGGRAPMTTRKTLKRALLIYYPKYIDLAAPIAGGPHD